MEDLITVQNSTITLAFVERLRQYAPTVDDIHVEVLDSNTCSYFKGDFAGLLNKLRVPIILHGMTMSLNNIRSSSSYDGRKLDIKLYNLELLGSLINIASEK